MVKAKKRRGEMGDQRVERPSRSGREDSIVRRPGVVKDGDEAEL